MSNIITLDSFPFDYQEVLNTESGQMEADREYDAERYRKYFAKFLSNGVYFGEYKGYKENSMKVSSDGGMNISVAKGAGLIEGCDFENETERIFTLERPISGERIDRVVIKFDKTLDSRETQLYIKEGTETGVAELERDNNVYEICLAEIIVRSTSNITDEDITDKRLNKELCGIVNSLISVDGEELYRRFKEKVDKTVESLVRNDQDCNINGTVTANRFVGDLEGNADTATNAESANVSLECSGNAATATIATTAENCIRKF